MIMCPRASRIAPPINQYYCRSCTRRNTRSSLFFHSPSSNSLQPTSRPHLSRSHSSSTSSGKLRVPMKPSSSTVAQQDHAAVLQRLSVQCPRFPLLQQHSHSVDILCTPQDYFEALCRMIQNAEHRIVLCSLYLGTGEKEKHLVALIEQQMQRKPHLKVYFYFDKNRSQRGIKKHESTLDLLRPLLQSHPQSLFVTLYETPLMRHQSLFMASLLPERVNEAIGVQHMKIYLADDNLLMSGANLSDWYFENRHDRWVHFQNTPHLCNFYERLCGRVMTLGSSWRVLLKPNDEQDSHKAHAPFYFHYLQPQSVDFDRLKHTVHPDKLPSSAHAIFHLPTNNQITPVDYWTTKWRIFKSALYQEFYARRMIQEWWDFEIYLTSHSDSPSNSNHDTFIFPTLQLGAFNFHNDRNVTRELLDEMSHSTKTATISSAYFNFTSFYSESILNTKCPDVRIVTSAPQANGFYGSKGSSRFIPNVYSLMEKVLYEKLMQYKRLDEIKIMEYNKGNGWTYHAKGLWFVDEEKNRVPLTIVGSSNFGQRSVDRDVESQIVLFTTNDSLQQSLYKEQADILQHCSSIESLEHFETEDRVCGPWLTFLTKTILKRFL